MWLLFLMFYSTNALIFKSSFTKQFFPFAIFDKIENAKPYNFQLLDKNYTLNVTNNRYNLTSNNINQLYPNKGGQNILFIWPDCKPEAINEYICRIPNMTPDFDFIPSYMKRPLKTFIYPLEIKKYNNCNWYNILLDAVQGIKVDNINYTSQEFKAFSKTTDKTIEITCTVPGHLIIKTIFADKSQKILSLYSVPVLDDKCYTIYQEAFVGTFMQIWLYRLHYKKYKTKINEIIDKITKKIPNEEFDLCFIDNDVTKDLKKWIFNTSYENY
jgi:hypothetical protein